MPSSPSHYDTLGVARSADPSVLRAAYKALIQIHHPDRHPGEAAHARTVAINAAMDVLADPVRRAAYDAQLDTQAHAAHCQAEATLDARVRDAVARAQAAAADDRAARTARPVQAPTREAAAAVWAAAADAPPPKSTVRYPYTMANPTPYPVLVQFLGARDEALTTRVLDPGDVIQVVLAQPLAAAKVAYNPVRDPVTGAYQVALERVSVGADGSLILPLPSVASAESTSLASGLAVVVALGGGALWVSGASLTWVGLLLGLAVMVGASTIQRWWVGLGLWRWLLAPMGVVGMGLGAVLQHG